MSFWSKIKHFVKTERSFWIFESLYCSLTVRMLKLAKVGNRPTLLYMLTSKVIPFSLQRLTVPRLSASSWLKILALASSAWERLPLLSIQFPLLPGWFPLLPVRFPLLSVRFPLLSVRFPLRPVRLPLLPVRLPLLPVWFPLLPIWFPLLPVSIPQLPVKLPLLPVSIPQLPVNLPLTV